MQNCVWWESKLLEWLILDKFSINEKGRQKLVSWRHKVSQIVESNIGDYPAYCNVIFILTWSYFKDQLNFPSIYPNKNRHFFTHTYKSYLYSVLSHALQCTHTYLSIHTHNYQNNTRPSRWKHYFHIAQINVKLATILMK